MSSSFVARKNVPLSAQLADQIRDRIEQGVWPVGHRIPPENELTAELGISRNSVREGLRALVHAGLLEAKPGDGTYVKAKSELQVAMQRQANRGPNRDVTEVRCLLERFAARQAATRGHAEEFEAMAAALDTRDASSSYREFLKHDLEFHRLVAEASGNKLLAGLYRNLDLIETHMRSIAETSSSFEEFREQHVKADDHHRALLSALRQRDPAAAEQLASEILDEAR